MSRILKVSFRQSAIYVPEAALQNGAQPLNESAGMLVAFLSKAGYSVSEALLQALRNTDRSYQETIRACVQEITGLDKNWTPLVKGWDKPTGESLLDHVITFFAQIFPTRGKRLPCGHLIPENTFPLERYNGCPFCGTPFETGALEYVGQGSRTRVLELWTIKEAESYLTDLLASKTALDATQMDSLKLLLSELPLPQVTITVKETLMAVVDLLIEQGKEAEAGRLFTSPADVLRYLWYQHTGLLQVVEPKTILNRVAKNNRHLWASMDGSAGARILSKASLKLNYSRRQCAMVAQWINTLPMETGRICEVMHPRRGMWVRFIRALRLAEYSRRKGYEQLRMVIDKFYRGDYEVWQGRVDRCRLRYEVEATFRLLQQRPGLFARSLFANMLWFGPEKAVPAFEAVVDKVPARLVFTLQMYADHYFDPAADRLVKPLGGVAKKIPAPALLKWYDEEGCEAMKEAVKDLCLLAMKKRFAAMAPEGKTIYIDPVLFRIPLAIGDRSDTVQDSSAALTGTRFAVEGTMVRLYMQWGAGLKAQHLDMDLSCHVGYEGKTEMCSFANLVSTGCKHSGDIRSIPDMVGTAEYIDVDLEVLAAAGARYVTFTCNAYSNGSISPGLVVGWMNSRYPMKISERTGVAYDPTCVQHQVRIVNPLSKGLVFGMLDVVAKEIIWLELPFQGQLVQDLDATQVGLFLKKLESKLTIGQLLQVKAEAQGLAAANQEHADEVYTPAWAQNTAKVTQLLVG